MREIARINERELELAVEGAASWHDDYRGKQALFTLLIFDPLTLSCLPPFPDSAYIFVGNLDKRLTEGDVIKIFSQYGEVLDINLPRIPEGGLRNQRGGHAEAEAKLTHEQRQQQQTGKPGDRRGFGFLLYEDQRSTVLAVDNLNGFSLLGRTLRVDHVRDYKMPRRRNEEGEVQEVEEPSRNAAPQMLSDGNDELAVAEEMDLEDPMAAYITKSKRKHSREEREEHERRKEERRRRREEKERKRGVSEGRSGSRGRDERAHRHRQEEEDRQGDRNSSPNRFRYRGHDENDHQRNRDSRREGR